MHQELDAETQELVVETHDQPLHRENDGKSRVQKPLNIIELDTDDEKSYEVVEDISMLKAEKIIGSIKLPYVRKG